MTLGEKIRVLRQRAGLSQSQLAQQLNVSRAAIAKWENDNGMPDVENLKALAAYFCCDLDALLDSSVGIQNQENIPECESQQSFCGLNCENCISKRNGFCKGCLDGPGISADDKCEIAACCNQHRHTSCGSCTANEYCATLAKHAQMPAMRQEDEAQRLQFQEIKQSQARFLKDYLWVLVGLALVQAATTFLLNDWLLGGIPILKTIGEILESLILSAHGVVLLRISPLDRRMKTAGLCMLVYSAYNLLLMLPAVAAGPNWILVLITFCAVVIYLYRAYYEFCAFSSITKKFDEDLSKKWNDVYILYISSGVAELCGLILAMVFKTLGLLIVLVASICSLVASIKVLIYRYSTAEIILKDL